MAFRGGIVNRLTRNLNSGIVRSRRPSSQEVFTTSGSRILDPQGVPWYANGVNLLGPYDFWNRQTAGRSGACGTWNFGIVRLNTCLPGGGYAGGGYTINNNIQAIVNEYTAAGIVVMIDCHQNQPGTWPGETGTSSVATLNTWWQGLATQFKDNPYVWYDLLNEPGNEAPSTTWLTTYRSMIQAVRTVHPSALCVVSDGWWGQGAGTGYNASFITSSQSSILAYGATLLGEFDNIVFTFHAYDQWGPESLSDAQRDARMGNYIDQVHALGAPIIMGESGYNRVLYPGTSAERLKRLGTLSAYRVCEQKSVSHIHWHGTPGDNHALVAATAPANDFDDINSSTNPTNLTDIGQAMWNLTH